MRKVNGHIHPHKILYMSESMALMGFVYNSFIFFSPFFSFPFFVAKHVLWFQVDTELLYTR